MTNQIDSTIDHSECQIYDITPLPYHCDGECHLILNDNFYIESPMHDPFDGIYLDEDYEYQFEKMECSPKLGVISEISSEASGSTGISDTIECAMPVYTTLDSQLDFIMETTKKHKKPHEPGKKRNKKTPHQLKILMEELGSDPENADKKKIKVVAEKTGLTELQVYKWCWDRKVK